MSWVSKLRGGKKPKSAPVKPAAKARPPVPKETVKPRPPAAPPSADVQKQQMNELAQAVFRVVSQDQKAYANREEFAAGWRESRGKYLRMARKMVRYLDKRGIQLTGSRPGG